jgi:NADH-quinone oxidoreductase subunit I
MTDTYDRSMPDLKGMIYKFSEMSPEDAADKRFAIEQLNAERLAAKEATMQQKIQD